MSSKTVLKFNVENEQIVLAAAMSSPEMMKAVCEQCGPSDFTADRHKVIISVLKKIAAEGGRFEYETFIMLAGKRDFGGEKYISSLEDFYEDGETTKNIDLHLTRLRDDSLRYRLATGDIKNLQEAALDPNVDRAELYTIASDVLMKLAKGEGGKGVLTGEQALESYKKELRERCKPGGTFVPYGLKELDDKLTEGQGRGTITTITSRPSVGKSTLSGRFIMENRMREIPTLVCPQEPGTIKCFDTCLAGATGIPIELIIKRTAEMTKQQKQLLMRHAQALLLNSSIKFVDDSYMNLSALDRYLSQGEYRSVYIDLFEMILGEISPQEVTKALDRLLAMAKHHGVCMNILHQIGRSAAKRKDQRPSLIDLKNAGAYEERSDLILGLHRDAYYDPDVELDILEVWILKQRIGARNDYVAYDFDAPYLRIGDYASDYFPNRPGMGEQLNG